MSFLEECLIVCAFPTINGLYVWVAIQLYHGRWLSLWHLAGLPGSYSWLAWYSGSSPRSGPLGLAASRPGSSPPQSPQWRPASRPGPSLAQPRQGPKADEEAGLAEVGLYRPGTYGLARLEATSPLLV